MCMHWVMFKCCCKGGCYGGIFRGKIRQPKGYPKIILYYTFTIKPDETTTTTFFMHSTIFKVYKAGIKLLYNPHIKW